MTKEAIAVERAVRSAQKPKQQLEVSPYNTRGVEYDMMNKTAIPLNDPFYVKEKLEVRNETWKRVMSNKIKKSEEDKYELGKQLGVYFQHEKAKREQDKMNRLMKLEKS